MTFQRTRDWTLIKFIVTNPKIYPHVSDDFSPEPEVWEPVQDERVTYLLAKDDNLILGLWMLHPDNFIVWKVHTCLLPCAYGEKAASAAKQAIEWVWANTVCRRIITEVPSQNRLALRFAKRAGMTEYGLNPRSFMKNGTLEDVILLGISKQVTI